MKRKSGMNLNQSYDEKSVLGQTLKDSGKLDL